MMTPTSLKSITLKLASADEIRAMSGGEVTADATFDDSDAPVAGGLFCPSIFGADGQGFGHIELACPVAHPWYEGVVRLLTGMDDLSDGAAVMEAMGQKSKILPQQEEERGEPDFAHRCVAAMRRSGMRPDTLVLQAVPVVPPAMRPHVRASGGAMLSSDLNELYQRVIARSNALREMLSAKTPAALTTDARQRLISAVRALVGDSTSPLQSLTDLVSEPNGVIKRNLAGKRQDYSGRSVIVSGPELKLTQCGFPYEMALEQFGPFIARKLMETGAAASASDALERMAHQPYSPEVRRAAEQVAAEKLILLNRAPTLHRLGIQPFEPVLTDHRSIALHPLVCYAFNADFDGDQMAAHVPISASAQAEAMALLDSAVNLVSPANGAPIAGPVQDIVLGLWWMTGESGGPETESGGSADAVAQAVLAGEMHPHAPVVLEDLAFSGEERVETTAGRVLLNSHLPRELRFVNRQTGRGELSNLVALCLERCGRARTRQMLDDLNRIGFEFATRFAPSYGLGVVPSSESVDAVKAEAFADERKLRREMEDGRIDREAFREQVLSLWAKASEKARGVVRDELASGEVSPILAMIESGARGTARNLGATFGIPGPAIRNPEDAAAFEAPVTNGFWIGMNQMEHFARTVGARKGLTDTSVRSLSAHTLMRDLIYAGQGTLITSEDCGTTEGVEVSPIEWNGRTMETIAQRIGGRVAADDITGPNGEVIVRAGELTTREQAKAIESAGVKSVRIRSLLACREQGGLCAKCYGEDLAYGEMVTVGTAVGVIAAQAMSEPALQLTYRTHYPTPRPITPMPGDDEHPGGLQQMIGLLDGSNLQLSPSELVERCQCILRYQGVAVDDKHFELIARRMYSFTRITDPGDTGLLAGEVVANEDLRAENQRVTSAGGREASGEPTALGALAAAEKAAGVIGAAAIGDTRTAIATAALGRTSDSLASALDRLVAGLPPRPRAGRK